MGRAGAPLTEGSASVVGTETVSLCFEFACWRGLTIHEMTTHVATNKRSHGKRFIPRAFSDAPTEMTSTQINAVDELCSKPEPWLYARGGRALRLGHAMKRILLLHLLCALAGTVSLDAQDTPKAFIDGTGLGWREWSERNFAPVNCASNTWSWTNGFVHCTGEPIGVIRSTMLLTNLELVVEWRHLRSGGNSGVFLWATPESIAALEKGNPRLPTGLEVQVLDHGYAEQFEREQKRKPDWFTTHGDVFPTGTTKMKPFPPTAPKGMRSFPRKNLSKGVGEWNHYYVRAINGEVRLWVNGEEVSGGTDIRPAWGYLCLESEGAPVQFRNLRVRELP